LLEAGPTTPAPAVSRLGRKRATAEAAVEQPAAAKTSPSGEEGSGGDAPSSTTVRRRRTSPPTAVVAAAAAAPESTEAPSATHAGASARRGRQKTQMATAVPLTPGANPSDGTIDRAPSGPIAVAVTGIDKNLVQQWEKQFLRRVRNA